MNVEKQRLHDPEDKKNSHGGLWTCNRVERGKEVFHYLAFVYTKLDKLELAIKFYRVAQLLALF